LLMDMVEVQRLMKCLENFKRIKFRKNQNFVNRIFKLLGCNIEQLRLEKLIFLDEKNIYFMKENLSYQFSC